MSECGDTELQTSASGDQCPTESLSVPPVVLPRFRTANPLRLAHDGASRWALQEPVGRDFWIEQDGRRVFLPFLSDRVITLASCHSPVLITGARGTGKSELALVIKSHAQNPRRTGPLAVVDCEEMRPPEAEVALFGYGSGARRFGKLLSCSGGTVLVKNVDLLSRECIARLIRFLTNREVIPVDSDATQRGGNVRLLATTRYDVDALPERLADFFPERQRLPQLKEMKQAITILLAEFLRPYDAICGVDVRWLLSLLCHDWPGNIGELKRYCEGAKANAAATDCSVLDATLGPNIMLEDDTTDRVQPAEVVNSLLALSETEFTNAPPPIETTGVPDGIANSLRLLVRLIQGHTGGTGGYSHPDSIPLPLFFDGCRCPPCYEIEGVVPWKGKSHNTIVPAGCVDDFLRHVSFLVSEPSILTSDRRFRTAFGSAPKELGTCQPSPRFVQWVTTLRASVPNYEAMGAEMRRNTVFTPAAQSQPSIQDQPSIEQCRNAKTEVERILESRGQSNPLVGESDAMLRIYPAILRVARSSNSTNVFVYGDFGSGKEVLCKLLALIGKGGTSKAQTFDVTANSASLASAVFFGVADKSATGVEGRAGHIQLAGKGVLMCDGLEVAPPDLVSRLKRVLSERTYQRDGSAVTETAACRFVCCSNKPLSELLQETREFLNLPSRWPIKIEIPSLDDRKEDIPSLVREAICRKLKKDGLAESLVDRVYPPPERIAGWMNRSWKGHVGNVRGLFDAVDAYLSEEHVQAVLATETGSTRPPLQEIPGAATGVDTSHTSHVVQRNPGGRQRTLTDDTLVEVIQWAADEKLAERFTESKLRSKLRDAQGKSVPYKNLAKALSQRVRRIRNPELQQRARGLLRYLFGAMA